MVAKLFSGSTPEDLTPQRSELEKIDFTQFKEAESKRMKFNVSKVCDDVAIRINGAPGPGGYPTGFASQEGEEYFSDENFLNTFLEKEKCALVIPGSAYYFKVWTFQNHCLIGLKYMSV